jgi:hypothetical protein
LVYQFQRPNRFNGLFDWKTACGQPFYLNFQHENWKKGWPQGWSVTRPHASRESVHGMFFSWQ